MSSPTAPVTVIVPVYGGASDVERCIGSVLEHARTSQVEHRVLIIDDAAPDEQVKAVLRHLASSQHPVAVEVLANPQNVGFVRTVNRGLRHARGDVVVLNSDTVVTAGWLDRMVETTTSLPDVATVTPLSNFGSICTVPPAIIDAFALAGSDPRVDECAAFILEHSIGLHPEVISGVGFCLYITRAALDLVGELDDAAFGRGYGEEVDFCLRATALGLRHRVADDTFVYHRGGGSFGAERAELMRAASEVIRARYPWFRAANRAERARDPLAPTFAALELGLAERREDRPHVLHLLHNSLRELGGSEKHLRALVEAMRDEFDVSILHPSEGGFVLHTIWEVGAPHPVEHEFLLPGGPRPATALHDSVAADALATALDMFDFDAVHIHNLIGHSLAPLEVLASFEGPVVCSVRDLYLACPNHSLLYRDEVGCGIPDDLAVCDRCLAQTRASDAEQLTAFRSYVGAHLATVDTWVFASHSAADYLDRVYGLDPARVEIVPHGATIAVGRRERAVDEELVYEEPLRLAFVGMGWVKKGLAIVNRLADDFADSDIEIHHFGELKDEASAELHAHGPYDNEVLPDLLRQAGIHIVLLPGPYAETFGHVMTEALAAGLPVIAARYGALSERIRAHGAGWTIDPDDHNAIRQLVEDLDACRDEVLRTTRRATEVPLEPVAATAESYARLYRHRSPDPVRTNGAER